jgi:hypothetical protein
MIQVANNVALLPAAIIGLLVGLSGTSEISVLGWTLQVALASAATCAESNTCLGRAFSRWPRTVGTGGRVFVGVDAVVRRYVRSGVLRLEGSGQTAIYRVCGIWADENRSLARALAPSDRSVLEKSAQSLVATLTTLSKKSRASIPVGSVTI